MARFLLPLILSLLLFSQQALAADPPKPLKIDVCYQKELCISLFDLTVNLNNAFFYIAIPIAAAIFLVGAFLMTISGGQDTLLQSAKRAMKGSLIGVSLVVGSYAIYRTVIYLLYS